MGPQTRIDPSLPARLARFVLWWLFSALLYLLLVGKLSMPEAVAAIAAGLPAAVLRAILVQSGRPFAGGFARAAWLAPRILRSIVADCARMTPMFLRLLAAQRPQSRHVEVPFDPGEGDPPSRTRRGLVAVGVSLGPNQYVTGVRFETRRLLVHQLRPTPASGDERWPV